jgi:DNA polymerase III sliding clamp (beta) subunit (PCNA family)
MRAVATDGHRLARVEIPAPRGSEGMPGVIIPRKAVAEIVKLVEDGSESITIELSSAKVRMTFDGVVLTSKLIDGSFPDYQRVIPAGNDKVLVVERADFAKAVDRVSTISSERGRAVKLAIGEGRLMLSVNNPDSGSATEEIEVDYDAAPLDIGFNARYLLDITAQLDGDTALFKLADPGLAHAHPGPGRRRRPLRPDAHARVGLRRGADGGALRASRRRCFTGRPAARTSPSGKGELVGPWTLPHQPPGPPGLSHLPVP